PEVDVRLTGIGSAITPIARLPFLGRVTDDYGVASARMVLELPDQVRHEFVAQVSANGEFRDGLDLRLPPQSSKPLNLAVGSRATVFVEAQDRFASDTGPHTGRGDRFELEIVTAEQLLALLESQELGLRQRMEQIVEEMRDLRDSLQQARAVDLDSADTRELPSNRAPGAEPDDRPETREAAGAGEPQSGAIRVLRIQRGQQHAARASQEVLGVALEFDGIREELRNNRVDSTERQRRLRDDISHPLSRIADPLLLDLARDLAEWEKALGGQTASRQPLADARPSTIKENASTNRADLGNQCVTQADEIIVAMEQVLDKMLDLETYNELLDLVRDMIREQEQLEQKTREEQRRKVLEL
ncbi:MAG TPA: hypothetical protein VIY86_07705, partial [Pirellulaceae bacterium]